MLPADVYNRAHALLARGVGGSLFVPIRSMQVLAVLDREEFIFVDREGGRMIDIAWQRFRPQARTTLDAPVAYEAVYYVADGAEIMCRLQGEFFKALKELRDREPRPVSARVLPLNRAPG